MTKQSPEEKREKARLASERWRRSRGIMPAKPAQRPWLALGISRSTWYRRRAEARSQAALAVETNRRRLLLSRAEAFVAELQRDLARASTLQAQCAAILAEFPATPYCQ